MTAVKSLVTRIEVWEMCKEAASSYPTHLVRVVWLKARSGARRDDCLIILHELMTRTGAAISWIRYVGIQ